MYRTGKENFLTIPPTKSDRGNDFQTVDKPTSFCTHGIFSDLPPEIKGLFDGFQKNLDGKKFIFGKSHGIKEKV